VWADLSASAIRNEQGEHVATIGVIIDITERKRAEEALRSSEERFRAVFESARDNIFIKDRSLRYSAVNPAVETLFGHKATEILGRKSEDFIGEEAGKHVRELDLRVLRGETIEEERTIPIRGVPLTFHQIRTPLMGARGEIVGICGISRDVTGRRSIAPVRNPHTSAYPSQAMRSAMAKARQAAQTESIILLLGESGSGKDFLARFIHDHSYRSGGPYFAINCAAVSHELAESELFGYESGAFTGARGRKRGLLELAEGGTLLLNEIGELSPSMQSKLLTFLDTRSFLRVGGEKSVRVDARLIAATHRDLETEVAEGRFLEPLFYRLNVSWIRVPPLRERTEDIPILVEELLNKLSREMQITELPAVDSETLAGLARYHWPGNIRELRNVLERGVILSRGQRLNIAGPQDRPNPETWSHTIRLTPERSLRDVTDEITEVMCSDALQRCEGNKSKAASLLGISRDSMYRHMKRLGIARKSDESHDDSPIL
jgi:PAS domain S-box-containing protein